MYKYFGLILIVVLLPFLVGFSIDRQVSSSTVSVGEQITVTVNVIADGGESYSVLEEFIPPQFVVVDPGTGTLEVNRVVFRSPKLTSTTYQYTLEAISPTTGAILRGQYFVKGVTTALTPVGSPITLTVLGNSLIAPAPSPTPTPTPVVKPNPVSATPSSTVSTPTPVPQPTTQPTPSPVKTTTTSPALTTPPSKPATEEINTTKEPNGLEKRFYNTLDAIPISAITLRWYHYLVLILVSLFLIDLSQAYLRTKLMNIRK